jgi:hypothetical protein
MMADDGPLQLSLPQLNMLILLGLPAVIGGTGDLLYGETVVRGY